MPLLSAGKETLIHWPRILSWRMQSGQRKQSGSFPFFKSIWDSGTSEAFWSRTACERGQSGEIAEAAEKNVWGKLLFFGRTEGTPGAFRHLCDSKATNGTLYEIQYTNLRHLSEIYCAGRYACVLHRWGFYGCDALSEHLSYDGKGACVKDDPWCDAGDQYYRHSRNWNQSLSMQGGDGHCGEACRTGCKWSAHCRTGRGDLPETFVEPQTADRFLAGRTWLPEKVRGGRTLHDGRHCTMFHRWRTGLL